MDGKTIAAKVAFGYAKAAQKIGVSHSLYRPSAALVPALAPQNKMRDLPFITNAVADYTFEGITRYGQSIRFGLYDTRAPVGFSPDAAVRVGDYFFGPTGTYLVISQEMDEPLAVLLCGTTVNVVRTGAATPGKIGYSGHTVGTDTPIMTGYPAGDEDAQRTMAGRPDLPGDVPMKGAIFYLPHVGGAVIRTSDRVINERGERFVVSSAELTNKGWRLNTTMAEA